MKTKRWYYKELIKIIIERGCSDSISSMKIYRFGRAEFMHFLGSKSFSINVRFNVKPEKKDRHYEIRAVRLFIMCFHNGIGTAVKIRTLENFYNLLTKPVVKHEITGI